MCQAVVPAATPSGYPMHQCWWPVRCQASPHLRRAPVGAPHPGPALVGAVAADVAQAGKGAGAGWEQVEVVRVAAQRRARRRQLALYRLVGRVRPAVEVVKVTLGEGPGHAKAAGHGTPGVHGMEGMEGRVGRARDAGASIGARPRGQPSAAPSHPSGAAARLAVGRTAAGVVMHLMHPPSAVAGQAHRVGHEAVGGRQPRLAVAALAVG